MKHTPGPWEAEYDDYGDELWFGGEGYGLWKVGPCYLGGDGDTKEGREQMQANASLISAAPDMRYALEYCIDTIETAQDMYGTGDLDMAALSYARAAIAKARGGE